MAAEPLVAEAAGEPLESSTLADSLSMAFLIVLETLTPTERAVFILREVLNYEFAEIAPIVGKAEVNCRQILARARQRIGERRPRFEASPEEVGELMRRFDHAVRRGELDELLDFLAADVVLISDGGGKARALLEPLAGAGPVARLLIGAARKFGSKTQTIERATVNGLPGLVSFEGGQPLRVMAFGIQAGQIHKLFIITNPDKLRHLARES